MVNSNNPPMIYTVEDCLEIMMGFSDILVSPPFELLERDKKILQSIGSKTFKGVGLTDKQLAVIKKILLTNYVQQFSDRGIDLIKSLEQLRGPLRELDRSTFIKIEKVLDFEKPDAVIILGDTNSALSAICVKRKKIPIFHIEAGNRCFDERVPEEINRKIVDHIADINLTYSSYASANLAREGLHKDRTIKIGSPLYEVYNDNYDKIERSKILRKLNIENKKFIIASVHREENLNNKESLKNILDSLLVLKKRLRLKIIF
jgi:UDP-N-acetylglucosamine 2-epimerase